MSPCPGEPMPVVARSLFHSTRCNYQTLLLTVVLSAIWLPLNACGQDANAQEQPASQDASSQPAAAQPPAADEAPITTEATGPEITPGARTPIQPVPQDEPAAVQPLPDGVVGDACLSEQLAQQQLTRTLRDLREMLPRPTKEEYEKVRRPFVKLLEEGYGASDVKTIQTVLEYTMLQSTDPEFVQTPSNMNLLVRSVTNDISKCGSKIGNAASKKSARRKYNLEVLTVARKMLTNNLDSRLAALTIISQLYDEEPQGPDAKLSLIKEAIDEMIAVINDKNQPDSVKVRAADGLANALRNCSIAPQDQDRMSDALGGQLARPCAETAYQLTLIESLMMLTQPLRTVGNPEPLAMRHLAAVLNDESRPLEVRCYAALGVGRAAWHPRFKADPLAWKIVDLSVDAGIKFATTGSGDPSWPLCGSGLFFAYRHFDATPVEASKGLMNRASSSAVVNDSFPLVFAVAVPLLENKGKIPIEALEALAAWRDANRPADLSWDSAAPPLSP